MWSLVIYEAPFIFQRRDIMRTSRDMTLKEFMSVIEVGKERHEKRTAENIEVKVSAKIKNHNTILYLEVNNHTTGMNCKRGIFLDEFVNYEDPRGVLVKVLFNTVSETTDWYIYNERETGAC